MDQDNPDPSPARRDPAPPFPPQTPDYDRKRKARDLGLAFGLAGMLTAGLIVLLVAVRLDSDDDAARVGWVGTALVALSVLISGVCAIKAITRREKDVGSREPGTAELLTVRLSKVNNPYDATKVTVEMRIQLPSGQTHCGSYYTCLNVWSLPEIWQEAFPRQPGRLTQPLPDTDREAIDAIFQAGARWRCLYNPNNPDEVAVFPLAPQRDRPPDGDELLAPVSSLRGVLFHSAT